MCSICWPADKTEVDTAVMPMSDSCDEAHCVSKNTSLDDTHACGLRKRKKAQITGRKPLPSEACGEHAAVVKSRQKDTLAAFGCICKAMLARGLQSCCSPRPQTLANIVSSSFNSRKAAKSRASLDTRCTKSCCEDDKSRRSLRSNSRALFFA